MKKQNALPDYLSFSFDDGLDWYEVDPEDLKEYGTACGHIPEKSSCIDDDIVEMVKEAADKVYIGVIGDEIQTMMIVPKKNASSITPIRISEAIERNGGTLDYQENYKGTWYFESE